MSATTSTHPSGPSHAGGRVFLDFFFALREHRVPVAPNGWLALIEALGQGLHENSLQGFYQVARCVLVQSEAHYDAFDQAFAATFRGALPTLESVLATIDEWLADPAKLRYLDPATRAALEQMDLEALRREFEARLREQHERHEGGSHFIGTGGSSPFGQGGAHPSGVRMGGAGGGRSALIVADARRFRAFRRDVVLDTRQIAAALRRLRRLDRKGPRDELDLDATIDETAKNAGDLEIIMRPPRKNAVRMLLLLDVGGSMDPHADLVSRLFSAAHRLGGFKELESYYFHNCVYSRVYEDAAFRRPVAVAELLTRLDPSWYVVVVGDAWMHPGELMMSGGGFWSYSAGPSGLTWLARIADRFERSAWLNPEPERLWDAPTIEEIGRVFPMYPLSVEGLDAMIAGFRRPRPATRRAWVERILCAA